MKKLLLFILIFNANMLSFAQHARFPEITLKSCSEIYITETNILECEENNSTQVKLVLNEFYPRVRNFLPLEQQKTLDTSQQSWDKLITTECQLANAIYPDSLARDIKILNCINHKSHQRVRDLIYTVVLWENILGSFQ